VKDLTQNLESTTSKVQDLIQDLEANTIKAGESEELLVLKINSLESSISEIQDAHKIEVADLVSQVHKLESINAELTAEKVTFASEIEEKTVVASKIADIESELATAHAALQESQSKVQIIFVKT
jgi:DNA repair exonuclease SbcCD ATPase subunit